MVNKSPLDDPENAAFAWRRFRRIMRLLGWVTALTVLIFVSVLYAFFPHASIHMFIAVALGVGLTMLLGGSLMALTFLSHGTGHDEAVDNRLPDAADIFARRDDK